MPKELTHWMLAKKAGDQIVEEGNAPAISRCIREAPNLFLLGAVGPDFLFYYLTGKEKDAFQSAAMVLHGRDGGNTLRPLAETVKRYSSKFGTRIGAFLLGYLCHVVADSVFHPWILYTVGKGTEQATYEHHVLESSLDLFVKDRYGAEIEIPLTLKELTHAMERNGELHRDEFLQLLGTVSFLGNSYSADALEVCLKRFEWLQELFWSSLGRGVTRVLKLVQPKFAFLEASVYQKRFHRYAEGFMGTFSYRHPVTGEERQVTIEGLVEEMVQKVGRYGKQLEPLFKAAFSPGTGPGAGRGEKEAVIAGFKALEGPNLETGLFGDRADTIRYTNPEGLAGILGQYGYRYR
ncbi:MAG TPA: zinc dependent phospholipase C family protein [Spirochaetales bacterium]|mgnify:CR=1 FL=1|nr:zinc dependent phospholipase C family protein [Spirochaetales bacterium]HOV38442.1 zinc dependent phospholipase C family protein [Spirochaetales bacterium]